jgi:dipeptidyl aminopeptidase/acylaminoacyl peptidase
MLAIPYSVDQYILDAAGEFVYFKVADNKDGKQGLYKASLKNNKAQELFLGDWMITDLQYSDRYLLFTLQNATSPENIWILDPLTKAKKQISYLNKHASEYSLGNSELVSWQSSSDLREFYSRNLNKANYPVIDGERLVMIMLYLPFNLQVLTNEAGCLLV